uniref:Uncharacterized protein n=1 Tax=Anguilla anguilla TaxID=7936 RepID=A0A0E9TFP5_ANGAN
MDTENMHKDRDCQDIIEHGYFIICSRFNTFEILQGNNSHITFYMLICAISLPGKWQCPQSVLLFSQGAVETQNV